MLDRLTRREKPENIAYCTVLQVDAFNKRVLVRGRNAMQYWVEYLPDDFPDLDANHTVAVGTTGLSSFLVRRVSSVLPSMTVILEV
jgi:hypothetical protein